MRYTYSLQLLVPVLLICIFLQNCSSFANLALDNTEEHNKQLDIQAVLDKEFTAEGGHLVSFYQYNKDIKASVEVNPLDEKDKIYDEVEVVIEKGVELSNLVKLDRKTQQKRIKIQFSEDQKGKPKSVVVHKPWLVGGHGDVIIFCGNPGVGKSALCNSIFQRAIFSSGVSTRTGMTTKKQEYKHKGKLYIDTPGLADTDSLTRAAKEIEEALKENGNYKIVFVLTLESGRLSPEDVATVETICQAIKVPFEYGLIFNKVTKGTRGQIMALGIESYLKEHGRVLDTNSLTEEAVLYLLQMGLSNGYLKVFNKKPYAATILMRDNAMEDEPGKYFGSSSTNMLKLLRFIDNLKANEIKEYNVNPLDITNYKEKVQLQEKENKKLQEDLVRMQEENRRQVNDLDQQISKLKEEMDKKGEGFWGGFWNFTATIGCKVIEAMLSQPGPTCQPGPGQYHNNF